VVLVVALQLDSWSVGALAFDVLCGRPPFAPHEHVSREQEQRSILHEVRTVDDKLEMRKCSTMGGSGSDRIILIAFIVQLAHAMGCKMAH